MPEDDPVEGYRAVVSPQEQPSVAARSNTILRPRSAVPARSPIATARAWSQSIDGAAQRGSPVPAIPVWRNLTSHPETEPLRATLVRDAACDIAATLFLGHPIEDVHRERHYAREATTAPWERTRPQTMADVEAERAQTAAAAKERRAHYATLSELTRPSSALVEEYETTRAAQLRASFLRRHRQ